MAAPAPKKAGSGKKITGLVKLQIPAGSANPSGTRKALPMGRRPAPSRPEAQLPATI